MAFFVKTFTGNPHRVFEDIFKQATGIIINYDKLPRDSAGKPLPVGDTHFSLSHSGKYLAVAISDHPVGIDIIDLSKYSGKKFQKNFSDKVLAKGEKIIRGNILFNFSAKEAYLKKTGRGIVDGLNTIDTNILIATGKIADHSTPDFALFVSE